MSEKSQPLKPKKALSPAAKRALAEADARRQKRQAAAKGTGRQSEQGGPNGAEPTRYGDWERGGIAYDF